VGIKSGGPRFFASDRGRRSGKPGIYIIQVKFPPGIMSNRTSTARLAMRPCSRERGTPGKAMCSTRARRSRSSPEFYEASGGHVPLWTAQKTKK
jgi:hypothetical protein